TVWQEENLHAEVVVLPDGTISFPLVGSVPAAKKTTGTTRSTTSAKPATRSEGRPSSTRRPRNASPTREHRAAISRLGPCAIHRRSFRLLG
ncbi:hypothetical protein HGA89_02020, partial [bacterium]|nr:hypothetical protein [bacterium]